MSYGWWDLRAFVVVVPHPSTWDNTQLTTLILSFCLFFPWKNVFLYLFLCMKVGGVVGGMGGRWAFSDSHRLTARSRGCCLPSDLRRVTAISQSKCSVTWTLVRGHFRLTEVLRWKTQAENLDKEVEKHLWLANWFKISPSACVKFSMWSSLAACHLAGGWAKTSADNSHLTAFLRYWLNCSKDPYPQVVSYFFCCFILSMECRRNLFGECGQWSVLEL